MQQMNHRLKKDWAPWLLVHLIVYDKSPTGIGIKGCVLIGLCFTNITENKPRCLKHRLPAAAVLTANAEAHGYPQILRKSAVFLYIAHNALVRMLDYCHAGNPD